MKSTHKRIIAVCAPIIILAVIGLTFISSMQPRLLPDGTYEPSAFMLGAMPAVTDYDNAVYPNPYKGNLTVLVVCTEESAMTMANGKKFSTGNHPVETFLPMLHMQAAGFDFEIATLTGKSAQFEKWALPTKDKPVMKLYDDLAPKIKAPTPLAKVPTSLKGYAAIFLPGGHGAMLGLPESPVLGKLLRAAHSQALPTITLCHGPAALLAAAVGAPEGEPFIYDGYEMMIFPDPQDVLAASFGYTPGAMPWWLAKRVTAAGVKMLNKDAQATDGSTHVYKEMVSGDSPQASNKVGKLAAEMLLKKYA